MAPSLAPSSPVVALGGIGLPAFAALPLIAALDDASVGPRHVVASGFGCLVAALWGCGFDASEIATRLGRDLHRRTFRRPLPGAGLALLGLGTGRLGYRALWSDSGARAMFGRWFGDLCLEDLAFPATFCLTDVETAEAMRISAGPLAELVYAACAHFPLLPPAMVGGRAVCDGSYLYPVPVMAAAEQRGPVLALGGYIRRQRGPRALENLHEHVFGLFHRHIGSLQHDSAAAIHPWPIEYWPVCVAETADAWDPAIVGQAIAAGRAALRDRPIPVGAFAGCAA